MENYPVLSLVVRFGTPAAIGLGLLSAAIVLALLLGPFGWLAAPVALIVGAVVSALAKSYVELVVLITEMLVPR